MRVCVVAVRDNLLILQGLPDNRRQGLDVALALAQAYSDWLPVTLVCISGNRSVLLATGSGAVWSSKGVTPAVRGISVEQPSTAVTAKGAARIPERMENERTKGTLA